MVHVTMASWGTVVLKPSEVAPVTAFALAEAGEGKCLPCQGFAASDLTGSAFGLIDEGEFAVRVRFSSEVSHLIRERIWHPSQKIIEEEDGSVTLAFAASGEKEILSWLFSYLPHVQLLEPEELKARFYAGLEKGLRIRDEERGTKDAAG